MVGTRRRGSTISVEIYDQGVGIDRDHLPHVFDEFYRGHASGDHDTEGVGLGLAILQRLATLSGFSLTLDSKRGVGTSVRLSGIPVARTPAAATSNAAADVSHPLSRLRVILVEDDDDVLVAIKGLLGRWGCDVQAHLEIPEAVADADIIVSDFDLGFGANGMQAIEAIRTQLGQPLPAILMTGHSEESIRQCINSDDITLLFKPVQPAMLRSALSSIRVKQRNMFKAK